MIRVRLPTYWVSVLVNSARGSSARGSRGGRSELTTEWGRAIQRREGILNVSVRADTLDVQNIRWRLRGIWDSVGIGIIVVDRRGSQGLGSVTNQNRDIDVVDDINRNRNRNRPRDGNINWDLNSVLHHLRDGNGDGNWNLHLNGTLNLLSNHDVVWARNMNRDGARNPHLIVD